MFKARSFLLLCSSLLITVISAGVLAEPVLPRFATHARTPINCADTPFGRSAVLGQDSEFVDMVRTSSSINVIQEYRLASGQEAPPYTRVTESGLVPGGLAGSTFLKSVAVDLNGDGRDEVVTANRLANGNLILGVFRRSAGVIELLDTWTLNQTFGAFDMVAGDLNGSSDRRQELGLLLRTMSNSMRVLVLTGAGNGAIAESDNTSSASWTRSGAVGLISLAVGDMILDGHEQLVVVNETGSGANHALNYHLLEYLPTTIELPVVAGDVAIGTRSFTSVLGTSFEASNGTPTLESMIKLDADAGDVVDSAAAELVVHLQVRYGGSQVNYIGQRLHHFTTVRDAENGIVSIGFFSRGTGHEYDSSRIVQAESEDPLPSFEATIASIDRISPAEIILARSDPGPRLLVSAYKAQVDFLASFLYSTNGRLATFTDQTTGEIATRTWNFGDSSGPITAISPTHLYTANGTYTVTLTVTSPAGGTSSYSRQVTVGNSGSTQGGRAATYAYNVKSAPAYEASYPVGGSSDLASINVAVGDMDRDGIAEVMTIARNTTGVLLRSRWRLADTSVPSSFTGSHIEESQSAFNSLTGLDVVAADLDGDSVRAVVGADCRQVEEPQLRQVVWLPPYFNRLQEAAQKFASFGTNTSQGSSIEESSGSFTSHDVSAYIGLGLSSPVGGASASVKATAGYNEQVSRGALHGTENSLSVDQSSSQTTGEALAVIEENSFNCYTYAVEQNSTGVSGNSSVRMCEIIPDSTNLLASDAATWDTFIPAASPAHPPSQWMPLHRDWASLSLFRSVTTNAVLGAGQVPALVTDGVFDTAVSSQSPSQNPYLEIDLGSVQDISGIRISPRTGQAIRLQGFRVYASANAFAGAGIPMGAGVRSFAPETADDVAYDRWNIWTRDTANPVSGLLRARYLRLQHPGTARLDIAEIQVFGDIHVEPPAYPEVVCDPVNNDGYFLAQVWDAGAASFRTIQMRGDLLWNGSAGNMPGCTNYSGLPSADIWPNTVIGPSGDNNWNLSQTSTSLTGSTTSFESSTRVGAEFDLEAGFIVSVVAGGAYEFSKGITEDVQSSSYWGSGLGIAGSIGGFATSDQGVINACKYKPRPYAYRLADKSNTGYEHVIYMVDYVVRQTAGLWTRANVPAICLADDTLFKSGFE